MVTGMFIESEATANYGLIVVLLALGNTMPDHRTYPQNVG